ncbi:long-chain fatty acid--CoA ligase [Actinomadura chibensis]|nr:long-chain fatty acid--CoA ligase [Actinomadura chibensis]
MRSWPLTVSSILRHAASVNGDRVIVTRTGEGVRTRTFAETAARAARLAHGLRALGVAGDERVATFQWNNAEHVEAYVGVPSMGAVLHTLNVRLPPEQIEFIVAHARDRVVIADAALAGSLAPMLPRMGTVEHVVVVGEAGPPALEALAASGKAVHDYEELLAAAPPPGDWPEVDEDTGAMMCYTSGTTGDPRGVVYSHRSIYLQGMAVTTAGGMGIGPSDRVLAVVPMFHANAWGMIHAALMAGADLVMPDRHLQAPVLAALIADERVSVTAGVPTVWADLLRYADEGGEVRLDGIRAIFSGGSAVPETLMRRYHDEYGVDLIQAFGMTETSPVVAVAHPPRDREPGSPGYWDYRGRAGRILAGVEARITAADGTVLPPGSAVAGEIEFRGPWVTGAYHGAAGTDRFNQGWLRSGDVGAISSDGYLAVSDRTKDVIKSGGEWISSVALENVLLTCGEVAEAAVVAIPDPLWGERPLACVVLRDGARAAAADLHGRLADRLPRWQVPEYWTFVESLPRTSVGKYDKKRLRLARERGELLIVELPGPQRRSG